MFEKEAEDEAFKKYPFPTNWDSIDLERNTKYEEGFKDGAEFGYNKANEWHYMKDGDLPNEDISVLVMLENRNVDISGISTDKRWFCTDYYTGEDKVVAWKEIVLPELPKEGE